MIGCSCALGSVGPRGRVSRKAMETLGRAFKFGVHNHVRKDALAERQWRLLNVALVMHPIVKTVRSTDQPKTVGDHRDRAEAATANDVATAASAERHWKVVSFCWLPVDCGFLGSVPHNPINPTNTSEPTRN